VLADKSVDVVIVTSRLAGIWAAWGVEILAEAHRVGLSVRGPLVDAEAGGPPAHPGPV
jgi:hypothetical protein